MKVYINSKNCNENAPRQIVEAKLIKVQDHTVVVQLPDGAVISRKKRRDIPEGEPIK